MIINIHGTIGVGKSTLAENLRSFLPDAVGYPEPHLKNPFLAEFYKNQKKYAFVSQLSFFNDLTYIGIKSQELKNDFVINDSSQISNQVFNRMLFESGVLDKKDFDLLTQIAKKSTAMHNDPSTINVVLVKKTSEVIKQIKERDRKIETETTAQKYFRNLSDKYAELFKQAKKDLDIKNNTFFVDVSGLDEVKTLEKVIAAIGLNYKINRFEKIG